MKKHLFTFALMVAGTLTAFAQENAPKTSLPIGAEIPEAKESFQSTDGKYYTLNSQKKDNGLIVMFSCNTCPYVIKSQARTKEIMKLAQESDLGLVIVNSNIDQRDEQDSYKAMQTYAENQGYTVPYIVDDNKLAPAFGATHTPEVFLFDASGKLVYKGAMEDNPREPASSTHLYLSQAIATMFAGGAIDPNTTKSIGCSIKNTK